MALFTPVPYDTKIDFIRQRFVSMGVSLFISLASIVGIFTIGLNYGVDFKGGYLLEVRSETAFNLSDLREKLDGLGLGEVKLQEAGSPNDIMIRFEKNDDEGTTQNVTID